MKTKVMMTDAAILSEGLPKRSPKNWGIVAAPEMLGHDAGYSASTTKPKSEPSSVADADPGRGDRASSQLPGIAHEDDSGKNARYREKAVNRADVAPAETKPFTLTA